MSKNERSAVPNNQPVVDRQHDHRLHSNSCYLVHKNHQEDSTEPQDPGALWGQHEANKEKKGHRYNSIQYFTIIFDFDDFHVLSLVFYD